MEASINCNGITIDTDISQHQGVSIHFQDSAPPLESNKKTMFGETKVHRRSEKSTFTLLEEEKERNEAKQYLVEHRKWLLSLEKEKVKKRNADTKDMNSSIEALLQKAYYNPTPYCHVETYGKVHDMDAITVSNLAKKTSPLTEFDFKGHYHLRSIQHEYPIPGTQLRIERERQLMSQARQSLLERRQSVNTVTGKTSRRNSKQNLTTTNNLAYKCGRIEDMLQKETDSVTTALQLRKVQLATPCGAMSEIVMFWNYLRDEKFHLLKNMIIEKKFPDINIAVARDRDGKIMEARDGSSTFCETPLMYACRHHWVDLVELFLQYGADPRITTFNGDTAMHAVFRDWPVRENAHRPSIKFTLLAHKVSRILRLLVSSHADTTLQNVLGDTPLHYCAKYGLREAAMLLMEHGACAHRSNRNGKSATDMAADGYFDGLRRQLNNFTSIQKANRDLAMQMECQTLFKTRGALSKTWMSRPSQDILLELENERRRTSFLGGRFVDRLGNVLLYQEDK